MKIVEVELDDVSLHCLDDGPSDGPLALCLHGFPDTAYTFRHLTPFLVQRGYHVVVPFMRGYAPSSISTTHDYRIESLAADAIALHDHFGGDSRSLLIGHDWGAAAAYGAIGAEPHRWHRAVTMAIPPLTLFATLMNDFEQVKASWYMFYFQSPGADSHVCRDDFAFLGRLWSDWSPGYDSGFDLGLVREALRSEEHLSAALQYYRSMGASSEFESQLHVTIRNAMWSPPPVPILYLHGSDDGCVKSDRLGDLTPHIGDQSRFRLITGAGHFAHLEQPADVQFEIEDFLNS